MCDPQRLHYMQLERYCGISLNKMAVITKSNIVVKDFKFKVKFSTIIV